jgi:hypothetical protein
MIAYTQLFKHEGSVMGSVSSAGVFSGGRGIDAEINLFGAQSLEQRV